MEAKMYLYNYVSGNISCPLIQRPWDLNLQKALLYFFPFLRNFGKYNNLQFILILDQTFSFITMAHFHAIQINFNLIILQATRWEREIEILTD